MILKTKKTGLKTKEIIADVKELLKTAKSISIITHQGPDGDAIGSSLGLFHFLKLLNKTNVNVIVPDTFPDFLSWMPGSNEITVCKNSTDAASCLLDQSDIIFCLDFNHTSRIPCLSETVIKSDAVKILIDHHPNPENFTKYIISETSASSTAELIYNFISEFDTEINQDIASCLFTGIMTDTGGFSHNSSHPGTFEIVANLLKTGIDKNKIFDNLYNNFSASRMRLMGYCLHQKMKVFPEYKTAYIALSQKELNEFNFQTGDTEGFVNLPLAIDGIMFSAFFTEKEKLVRTSFRSKGNFAVNNFSKNNFNGGGHTNAAGGESKESLDKTIKKFESLLPQYLNEIEKA